MIHKEQALKKGIKIIDSKETHNALFENLKTHFPQTIKDNQVDLKAIATLLGLETKANIQGYELTFTGKALANALYSTPTQKLLKFEDTYHNSESCKHSEESKNAENEEDSNAEAVEMRNCGFQGVSEGVTLEGNDRVNDAESAIYHSNATQDNTQNFIIKGDNLDVLKILKSAYSEKIKMIYIDPPYNTKNENFIYPDNFRKDYKAILQEVGLLEIDDEGNEVESETLQFFKNIQGSRTHSGWLAFMLPRLKLARDLLREDGVIFISIDDNEQANLKILCDEIFGEENFVACMCVESAPAGTQSSNFVAQQHSYCLVYTKSDCDNSLYKIMLTNDELDSKYIQKDEYGEFYIERLWKRGIGGRKEDVPSLHFPVFYDETMDRIYIDDEITESKNFIKIIPYQSAGVLGRWTWSKDKMMAERHRLVVKKVNGEWKLHKKQYKKDEQGKLPNSIIKSEIARTEIGSLELKNLIGEKVFDYPKPISLIKHLLKISTNANAESVITSETKQSSIHNENLDCHDLQSKSRNDTDLESKAGEAEVSCDDFVGCQGGGEGSLLNINDRADNADSRKSTQETTPDIVLDFFAGSGTTAHAVMELNAEDNGNRKFILVQIDEPINESKNKNAYDFCKNELGSKKPVISDITIERVKRASSKIASKNKDFKASFAVLSLSDKPELITSKKDALKLLSNANLSSFDKALNLALQSGKTLDKPLKPIFENRLYQCEDCLYLIACDKEVLEFLRNTQNEYIFIDGFEDLHLEDFLNLDSSLNDRLRVVY
ncbi:site-specific DNA-methyltransferase [uncultured Helicobacter sp.]|uniref:site-specific DNA-methyltransferase n=1 Tax=uncultured Helicobacter sp. TaxID=175537 RepID=UPI00374E79BB